MGDEIGDVLGGALTFRFQSALIGNYASDPELEAMQRAFLMDLTAVATPSNGPPSRRRILETMLQNSPSAIGARLGLKSTPC